MLGEYTQSGAVVGTNGSTPTATNSANNLGTLWGGIISQASGVLNPWGDNTLSSRSYVNASSNSNQSISASTNTKILFQTRNRDSLNEFSSSRYIALHAGLVDVTALIGLTGLTSGTTVVSLITYKNGSPFRTPLAIVAANNGPNYTMTDRIEVAAGDYIEVFINLSTAATVQSGSTVTIVQEA